MAYITFCSLREVRKVFELKIETLTFDWKVNIRNDSSIDESLVEIEISVWWKRSQTQSSTQKCSSRATKAKKKQRENLISIQIIY